MFSSKDHCVRKTVRQLSSHSQRSIIGHNSVATTLNIYAHITDDMRAKAAASIDRGIAKQEYIMSPAQKPASENMTVFTAVKGQRWKQGTGCVSQLGDHLWEGKYSPRGPDGKKRSGNVYAHTREECEGKAESPHSENENGACGRTRAGKTGILTDRKRPQNAVFCGQFLFQRWNSYGQKFSAKIQVPKKVARIIENDRKSFDFRSFLVRTTGLEPVTSCV